MDIVQYQAGNCSSITAEIRRGLFEAIKTFALPEELPLYWNSSSVMRKQAGLDMNQSSDVPYQIHPRRQDQFSDSGGDQSLYAEKHNRRCHGAILARLRSRDPLVLSWFVPDTARLVISRIRKLIPEAVDNDALVEELHVDCLTHIVCQLDKFNQSLGVKIETWVTVVCDNRLLDYRRSAARSRQTVSLDESFEESRDQSQPVPDSTFDPSRVFSRNNVQQALYRSLDEIEQCNPAYHRDVEIIRVELDISERGQTPTLAAIGAIIGESASTVCRAKKLWNKNGFIELFKKVLEKNGVWPWED